MTENVQAPQVSLGAGSYDYDTLKAATDAAVLGNLGDSEATAAALKQAVADSNQHPAVDTDPRDIPGYEWAQVEGSTGQIETIQVPIAPKPEPEPEKPAPRPAPAPAKASAPKAAGDQQNVVEE